jgi:hypothetical protein
LISDILQLLKKQFVKRHGFIFEVEVAVVKATIDEGYRDKTAEEKSQRLKTQASNS